MLSKAILARFGNTKYDIGRHCSQDSGVPKNVIKHNILEVWEYQSMLSKSIFKRFGNTKVDIKCKIHKIWEHQSCYQTQNLKTWEFRIMYQRQY